MHGILRFNPKPVPWVVGLFTIEVLIAVYVRDAWLRPYGGDVLAVVLVYAFLRSLFVLRARTMALSAFAVGALVELAQWQRLPARLELARYPALSVAVGSTFEWGDLVAYALGAVIAFGIDTRTDVWVFRA